MIGKVPPDVLAEFVLDRTGAADERVLQGPAYGEDTAAIEFGDETLVVNTDPISLAADRIGTLGVTIASNDIAASGGIPEWLTSVLFVPSEFEAAIDTITAQIDTAARDVGVSIVGGHTEYDPARSTPLLVLTCLGTTDRYIPTSGTRPGDKLIMTKSAGVEATAILASDFRDLVAQEVSNADIEQALTYYDDISILPEAKLLSSFATAMHDPTEGGVVDGLLELATAADVSIDVDRDTIPIRKETARLCAAVGIDPLRTFGSGALIAAVPADATDEATERLADAGIQNAIVGTVTDPTGPRLRIDGETYDQPVRDEMYALWE